MDKQELPISFNPAHNPPKVIASRLVQRLKKSFSMRLENATDGEHIIVSHRYTDQEDIELLYLVLIKCLRAKR